MELLVKVISEPSFYVFLGIATLPVMIFSKGKSRLPSKVGYRALVGGTLLLTIASFLTLLNEMEIDSVFVQNGLLALDSEDTRFLFLYLPGLIFIVFGLSRSLPNIKLLADEVTKRTKAEQELRLMVEEMQSLTHKAEQANRAKSNFLASMSHELRTPLNAIIGFAELLTLPGYENSKEKQQEYQEIILKSGKHLLSLINEILDLSRIEEGKLEINIEECDINTIINEAVETIKLAASDKNISILVNVEDHIIATDERFLKQMLINILSNAIKFSMSRSAVTVTSCILNDRVSILVEDEGIGMTEKEVKDATEPFYQVEDTYNRTAEGSGLGLALVKRFAEFIGGVLTITSEKGKGTVVQIDIPNLKKAEQSTFQKMQEMLD